MSNVAKLEKEVLSLPPKERERLALAAWESLEDESAYTTDATTDSEGVDIALQRDREIEAGSVQPINHDEFIRRTNGTE